MLSAFSYYTLLLLIIIFYLSLFFVNIKRTPKKIKIAMGLFLALATIKNIFLLSMALLNISFNINLAKIISFLDILYVPSIIVILFYIFWRSDKFNFNNIIKILSCLSVVYIILIFLFKSMFKVRFEYGYTIEMINNLAFRGINIFVFLVLLVFMVLAKSNKSSNNLGINILVGVIAVFIIENIVYISPIRYLPYCLVSELILIFAIVYGFKTFKS